MSKPNYQYDDWVNEAIVRCVRGLLLPGTPLKRATLQEDLGGIDQHYVVNQNVPLQVRARFNRPAFAADSDVTFRTTEPAMISARRYAPLALFVWFVDHTIVAGKLIDVYWMEQRLAPPLAQHPICGNGDGTAFHIVTVPELQAIHAVLKIFDGCHWATETLQGQMRLQRILESPFAHLVRPVEQVKGRTL